MTPEERLTKIERTLQSLTDAQVEHSVQIEKQNAGIRDLIVVGRTCLDSIQTMRQAHEKDYEDRREIRCDIWRHVGPLEI